MNDEPIKTSPMKVLRMQLSLRQLMIATAVVALVLAALPLLVDLFSDDGPFHAINQVALSWDVEAEPLVAVDVSEGAINVLPSVDGKVSAEITSLSVTSRSQWAAERALRTINVTTRQADNAIEIIATGESDNSSEIRGYITNTTYVVLRVPDGVRLSLRVGRGRIAVGEGYLGGKTVRQPVAASSIIARNQSTMRDAFGAGDIVIETVGPLGAIDGRSDHSRLQLNATGHIEIRTPGL
jgi:hypothetical protein